MRGSLGDSDGIVDYHLSKLSFHNSTRKVSFIFNLQKKTSSDKN
jgi:hypothetical protein